MVMYSATQIWGILVHTEMIDKLGWLEYILVTPSHHRVHHGILPHSLEEATHRMKNSALAKELFGEQFVEHFTLTREWECRQFAKVVTDWEFKRYFEII